MAKEWVRTTHGDWVKPEGERRFGWLISVNDAGLFQVNGKVFPSLTEAKAYCQAQEYAALPAELPAAGSVWGVPGKPETRRMFGGLEHDGEFVKWYGPYNRGVESVEQWQSWVTSSGAVRIDGQTERNADTDVAGKGLVRRYIVSKADGSSTDPRAFYFVLRLDEFGSDPEHIAACRIAARHYAANAPKHLAKMATELNETLDAFGAVRIDDGAWRKELAKFTDLLDYAKSELNAERARVRELEADNAELTHQVTFKAERLAEARAANDKLWEETCRAQTERDDLQAARGRLMEGHTRPV